MCFGAKFSFEQIADYLGKIYILYSATKLRLLRQYVIHNRANNKNKQYIYHIIHNIMHGIDVKFLANSRKNYF